MEVDKIGFIFNHPSIIPWALALGVHCIVDCPSPEIAIMCLPAESINVFLAPAILGLVCLI